MDNKIYNPPIMVAVAESELQRFRELETENTLLKVQKEGLKKENEQLKKQIKDLESQLKDVIEDNDYYQKENEKMKNHTNCKFFHEWNLANVMEEPLDDLSPCQGCKNFNKWEFAENESRI